MNENGLVKSLRSLSAKTKLASDKDCAQLSCQIIGANAFLGAKI
jgi:hypothetical protein